MIGSGADAELGAPGGVDDHMVALLEFDPIGVEKINLLPGAELDVHDLHVLLRQLLVFFHWFLLISIGSSAVLFYEAFPSGEGVRRSRVG